MTGCCDDGLATGARDLRERLRVVAVRGESLVVAADRASACAACAEVKGCGTKALLSMSRSDQMTIHCPPGLAVAAGDEVDVALSGNSFLAGVGLAYLLPALAFVIALALATGAGLSDLGAALVGGVVLMFAFLPLVVLERRARLSRALQVLDVIPGPNR